MRTIQKADITDQDLDKILNLGIELNSMHKATLLLIEQGKIKNYCTDTYYRRICKTPKYKEFMLRKKVKKKNMQKLAFMLRKKGYEYSQIGKIFKIPRIEAFYLTNPGKPKEYKKTIRETKQTRTIRQSQNLVDYWNKYSIEKRYPTDETIKAFEKLNLTPPERL